MTLRFLAMATCLVFAFTGCGGSPTAPSGPQVFEATLLVPSIDDIDAGLLNFTANRAGTLSARVDWTNSETDIDIFLLPGTCTRADVQAENPGCEDSDAIAEDVTLNKPAVFTVAVTERAYTFVVLNYSAVSETVTYRLEIN